MPDPARTRGERFTIRDANRKIPQPNRDLLAELDGAGATTVHAMIMADDVVAHLDYEQALGYATLLAERFRQVYEQVRPRVIIGGFDGLHSGISFAVARRLGIPWFAMHFTVIPKGYTTFCAGLTPTDAVRTWNWSVRQLQDLASRTLTDFEARSLTAPAYLSANTSTEIAARLPSHVSTLASTLGRRLSGAFDPCTERPPLKMCREYVRKRTNLFRLPATLLTNPPERPFIFYGLHRQPESSVDVWAPFASNQLAVVEAIARATPPTHQILIKLHKSDADNYSPGQLRQFSKLPGVSLVSPFASSRQFLERADLVAVIQGTLALEAALLRKPVVIFGSSLVTRLPGVVRAQRMDDLPALIRSQLSAPVPSREAVISGFADYLGMFGPGCHNDWESPVTPADIDNMSMLFSALRERFQAAAGDTPATPVTAAS
jgi:hypothetical protein